MNLLFLLHQKIIAEVDKDNTVAILFGREDRGLTNDELQRCNLHVHIPANKDKDRPLLKDGDPESILTKLNSEREHWTS